MRRILAVRAVRNRLFLRSLNGYRPDAGRSDEAAAMRIRSTATLALIAFTGAGLAACGHNMEQRVATGAIAGAVVAGPPGAVVGAATGAVINEADKPKR
jgi:osmotically inducible lipoprotein OsmB